MSEHEVPGWEGQTIRMRVPADTDVEQVKLDATRDAAAYLRHHLRRDGEALQHVVPAAIRNDLHAWWFAEALAGFLGSVLCDVHGQAGAQLWADALITKLAGGDSADLLRRRAGELDES